MELDEVDIDKSMQIASHMRSNQGNHVCYVSFGLWATVHVVHMFGDAMSPPLYCIQLTMSFPGSLITLVQRKRVLHNTEIFYLVWHTHVENYLFWRPKVQYMAPIAITEIVKIIYFHLSIMKNVKRQRHGIYFVLWSIIFVCLILR